MERETCEGERNEKAMPPYESQETDSVSDYLLRETVKQILTDADLSVVTSRMVRRAASQKLNINLDNRKHDIKEFISDVIRARSVEVVADIDTGGEAKSEVSSPPKSPTASKVTDSSSDEELMDSAPIKKSTGRRNRNEFEVEREYYLPRRSVAKYKTDKPARKTKKSPSGKRPNSSFSKQMYLKPVLAQLMGTDTLSTGEVVKRMYEIINERNLKDPKCGSFTLCDEELQAVFGRKRVRTFGMMKYLKNHMYSDKDDVCGGYK